MTLVLDTNILLEFERRNELVLNNIASIKAQKKEPLAITAPTFSEFYYGYVKKNLEVAALDFLSKFVLLNTTFNSSKILAEIKHSLQKQGFIMPAFDLFIASIVADNNATLVTHDKLFEKIESLDVVIL